MGPISRGRLLRIRARLVLLALAFGILLVVGRTVNGDFTFVLRQFWFTSGFLLLLFLSLIDQPYFSKDANIFINATTAWISLLLVEPMVRDGIWWSFLIVSTYLVASSYVLMWIRSREFHRESTLLNFVSRINREVGRPDALFSAFLLWGAVLQFGSGSKSLNALFLFWAVFMILRVPSIANSIDGLFVDASMKMPAPAGVVTSLISPGVAEVAFAVGLSSVLVGRTASIKNSDGQVIGNGIVVDDRILAGARVGRLAVIRTEKSWSDLAMAGRTIVEFVSDDVGGGNRPVSVVDSGSDVGRLVFHVPPAVTFEVGELVRVPAAESDEAFYQVVSGIVCQSPAEQGNAVQTVKVTAGQLGRWDARESKFRPIAWVASAGEIVHRLKDEPAQGEVAPDCAVVGCVPHSTFPIHVSVQDVVTHNTAVIGVTGSGKSYLAFHLIEAMVKAGIKVLILDVSRQHDLHLVHHDPTALKTAAEVAAWADGASLVGIHQYGASPGGLPKSTADFVEAAFKEMAKAPLERGKNIPARLCVVFEEAHSLVPEWNQVSQEGDKQQVNRTTRAILQGRKYGMGALVITQRTANVTKTILNQCNTIFALQSFDQTGLDFLKNYMGEEYSHAISTLPERHAILVGKASSSARPLIVRIQDMGTRWGAPEQNQEEGTES